MCISCVELTQTCQIQQDTPCCLAVQLSQACGKVGPAAGRQSCRCQAILCYTWNVVSCNIRFASRSQQSNQETYPRFKHKTDALLVYCSQQKQSHADSGHPCCTADLDNTTRSRALVLPRSCVWGRLTSKAALQVHMLTLLPVEMFTAQRACFSHAACNDQLQPPDVMARCHQCDVVMACCFAGQ